MQYGDELNQGTDYKSACVKCVCEVGPTPTCQRLPDDVCDVNKFESIEEDGAISVVKNLGQKITSAMKNSFKSLSGY